MQIQVRLKSISEPPLDDVLIRDPLFPVGRDEEPFSSYESKLTANLSRRHARIFQEAGHLYVADVGSRNGTRLNEKPVEQQPVKVHQGDILSFAGKLNYQVEIIEPRKESAELDDTATPLLVLIPVRKKSRLEPLVISGFPFLVGKKDCPFAAELEAEQEAAHYLSRRHAHIFSQAGSLFVEDLGSANGTFVNGERLGDSAHALKEGDELAFGAADLTFRVKLKAPESQKTKPDEKQTASGDPNLSDDVSAAIPEDLREHTIFVSSANSFLDIFCANEEEAESEVEAVEKEEQAAEDSVDAESDSSDAGRKTKPGLLRWGRNVKTFSGELRQALKEPEKSKSSWRWWVGGLTLVLAVVAVLVYFQDKDERDIQALLAAGEYREGALLAKAYLINQPDSAEAAAWSSDATLKALLPDWQSAMNARDFERARSQVAAGEDLVVPGSDAASWLILLQGITELHAYMVARGGVNAPLRLYQDETIIERLWQWWNGEDKHYRKRLQQLPAKAPGVGELHRLSFSYLRALDSERKVYLPAMDNLAASVEQALEKGNVANLEPLMRAFSEQYPRVEGVQALQRDWDRYREIQASYRDAENNSGATPLMADLVRSFETETFSRHVQSWLASRQPPSSELNRRQEADAAWRNGELEKSIALLEAVVQEGGFPGLGKVLDQKREILSRYQWLQTQSRQNKQSPDYKQRLIELYQQLQPERDTFLIAALGPAYQALGSHGLAEADRAWNQAAERWDNYRRDGGIRGAQRLEERISPVFRRKAQLLSEAWMQVVLGKRGYEALDRELTPEQSALHQKIRSESELQRRSLQQLSMVLNPDLLDAKLDLLADPSTDPSMLPATRSPQVIADE